MSKTEWLAQHRMKLLLALGGALAVLNMCASPPNTVVTNTQRVASSQASTSREVSPPLSTDGSHPIVTPWDRPVLEGARRNPFLPLPVAVPKPPPPVVQVVLPPPPPPEPVAPQLNTQFTGQMTAPNGRRLVYVTQDDITFVLEPGLTLPNGYQVERIMASAVEFIHPTFNTLARLSIPSPPKNESR